LSITETASRQSGKFSWSAIRHIAKMPEIS
jgi:hypothetical protein